MVARVIAHARSDGPPIAILPLGTANNIANSLGIDGPLDDLLPVGTVLGPAPTTR
jgi:diacylglycerol kinase family enzyme